MPGYSGTPLPKKLGIKPGARVAILNSEPALFDELKELPPDVRLDEKWVGRDPYDVIVLLAASRSVLRRELNQAADRLAMDGGLWIGWLKKSSGRKTDLTEADVHAAGLNLGLVDNKVCALTEDWSGLRFVVRLSERSKRK